MKKRLQILLFTLSSILISCDKPADSRSAAPQPDAPQANSNILLEAFSGPFGGVPAFDKMALEDLKPALTQGMALSELEYAEIANNPESATFENTIVALEKSGEVLSRVFSYWGIWRSNNSSPEFREIQAEMVPLISAFQSRFIQNEKLFSRIKAVYESENFKHLAADQQRLVQLTYDEFAQNGATLTGEAKIRYAEIEQELAVLLTEFGNNILADEEKYVLYLNDKQLSGLPESVVNSASAAAKAREKPGMYAITNTRSSMDPFLTYSDERDLREKVWRTYYNRGDNGDENDNNQIIVDILKLRHERVALLGYDNFAQWQLQPRMAKTPERAMQLLESVWPAAIARVKEEVADMQAIADKEYTAAGKNKIHIEAWDYRYYAEKVRQEKYALDSDEVKQYMQLNKLREAMFYVAGRLFNFKFTPVPLGTTAEGQVPVFHPDVKVWEVSDLDSGENIGLWYLDPFARKGKRSGAWATTYRNHTTFTGKKNVLSSNNSNFVKGALDEPVLISWDDAETYFHEFGHALHSLSSSVRYPTLNSGVRDYTEFQSQLLERWLLTDEVIDNYLVHYKTGKPIPGELVEKIKRAATFNEGFKTTEYLASAIIDMKLHTIDPEGLDVDRFERETLSALNMPEEIVMRHRTPQFGHIFSGESYAAGYYGYMWAEVLTSDAASAFAEAPGGFYDKDLSAKLLKHLFSVRNAVDPAEAYRAFRGRDANVNALMKDRGFHSK